MLADTDWFNRCAAINRIRRPNNLVVLVWLLLLVVDRTSSFVLDEVKSSGEQQLIPPSVTTFDSLSPQQQQQTSSSSSSLSGSSSLSLLDDFDLGRSQDTSKPIVWRKLNECKTDLNCINTNSICLNGNCVRICTAATNGAKNSNNSNCVYFHCDSKRKLQYRPAAAAAARLFNSNTGGGGGFDEFSIETNNYPLLSRYLSKKKCSWILSSAEPSFSNQQSSSSSSSSNTHRFIELKFERFSTQLANDYLYIFAGDSVYSPLIAALSGSQAASDEPSLAADSEALVSDIENERHTQENEDDDELEIDSNINDSSSNTMTTTNVKLAPLNVTFFNLNTLFLLFKTDVTSSYSILNNFKSTRFNNKPAGISIKYKFSTSCYNEILCYNEAIKTKFHTPNCSFPMNNQEKEKCDELERSRSEGKRLAETVYYGENESERGSDTVNSALKRAYHCSFEYNGYLYAVGGFSFSPNPLSFVSRLPINSSTDLPIWEHFIDRKPSTIINRSNRRFFGEPDFKHIKIDLPKPRYAHSCVVDRHDDHLYMFGGVIYDASETKLPQNAHKETTNELWSYNLQTNKWTLLNTAFSSTANVTVDVNSSSDNNTNTTTHKPSENEKKYILPIGVSGHSMHLVERGAYGKSILIFFGYSEYYASNLNLIQEYVLGTKSWLMHNTPTVVNIGFSHTSSLDPSTHTIYFHGGLVIKSNEFLGAKSSSLSSFSDYGLSDHLNSYSDSSSSASPLFMSIGVGFGSNGGGGGGGNSGKFAQSISSSLYSFDLSTFEWRKLVKSSHSCYAHTSLAVGHKLLFYGGVCDSNRFSYSSNSLFVSSLVRVYDLQQHQWANTFTTVASSSNGNSSTERFSIRLARRQRYAHSSFVYNRSMFVFAGFNGFFLGDLFKIDLERMGLDVTAANFTANSGSFDAERRRKRAAASASSVSINSDASSLPLMMFTRRTNPIFDFFTTFNKSFTTYRKQSNNVAPHRGELSQMQSRTVNSMNPSLNRLSSSWSSSHSSPPLPCNRFSSCLSCHLDPNCIWHESRCETYNTSAAALTASSDVVGQPRPVYKKPQCTQLCAEHTTCENCTSLSNMNAQFQSECVWCASQAKCVLKKAVHVLFPFGECVYMTSDKAKCQATPITNNVSSSSSPGNKTSLSETIVETHCSTQYSNCSSCIRDERCGWCSLDHPFDAQKPDYMTNSGLGVCLEGGLSGSSAINASGDLFNCTNNWFYTQCPPCECNGHAQCTDSFAVSSNSTTTSPILLAISASSAVDPNGLVCAQPCGNNTMGDFCQTCATGFFGSAENGGSCAECECGQQAKLCDSRKGSCFCHTKGVVGSKCDQCDSPRYTGRPDLPDGTCYYNLTTDYQFTFNLNKDSDRYYSRINFVNHISPGMDEDIDFMVRCFRETAYINVTYYSQYVDPNSSGEDFEDSEENDEDSTESDDNVRGGGGMYPHSISSLNDVDWPFELIDNLSYLWAKSGNNKSRNDGRQVLISPTSGKRQKLFSVDTNRRYYFGPMSSQNVLLARINCTTSELKYVFYNRDLNYADKNRHFMFVVYVYDFESPITVQVAFSRRTRVQLLHFFITFFGCLLSLLTIAFITWKSKQRYDRYRRQRQIVMQMEHMASRPFTRLFVDVVNSEEKEKLMMQAVALNPNQGKQLNRTESNKSTTSFGDSGKRLLNSIKTSLKLGTSSASVKAASRSNNTNNTNQNGGTNNNNNNNNESSDADLIEDKQRAISSTQVDQISRSFKVMPVAVEPLANNKSAILTCLLKLPQGGLNSTPKGASPFVLCSAYVQVNSSSSPVVNYCDLESDEIAPNTTSGEQASSNNGKKHNEP